MPQTELNPEYLEQLDHMINNIGLSAVLSHLADVCDSFKNDCPRWASNATISVQNWECKKKLMEVAVADSNYLDRMFPNT